MTHAEAMATIRKRAKLTATRAGAPGARVAWRFGRPVALTQGSQHIDWTPTAEDMAADDWQVHDAQGQPVQPPAPRSTPAEGTGWRRA